MKRIVILGGGFAGAMCAQRLCKKAGSEVEIVLIDRNNYMLFTPLLIEAGTGNLEPRHSVVPLRDFFATGGGNCKFRCAEICDIDTAEQRVHYRVVGREDTDSLHYDHLVIALGSVTRLPPVEGLSEYGYEIKNIGDAVSLRDRAILLLEQADATEDPEKKKGLLRFVVVGANFTGVEMAGEFDVFLRKAARSYPNVKSEDCNVTLIEMLPRILPALDEDLAEYASRQLRRRKLDILLESKVRKVAEDHAILESGERLDTRTVIWCAGVAPPPVLKNLDLPTTEDGWLRGERDLRLEGFENIWTIGDCSSNPGPDGKPYAPTAQNATRLGKHAADNILRVMKGEETKPCNITPLGSLAAIGCRTAVAKVLGVKLSGFPAWFLWRTVYLFKMPGLARKFRVATDWTVSLLFRAPIVQLGVHRTRLSGARPAPPKPGQAQGDGQPQGEKSREEKSPAEVGA